MRFRLTLALLFGVIWPVESFAHHERDELRRSILIELKSVSAEIKFARHRLNKLLTTAGQVSEERIGEAQNAFYQGRPERALVILQDLLSRPGFARHAARAEALFWYGEALLALQFHRAAGQAFADAASAPRQTRTAFQHRYERMLDVDRGAVAPQAIKAGWRRFQEMVSPDDPAFSRIRYKSGRGLYRSGAETDAESLFTRIVPADREYVRARYFLGVIHLRRGEIIAAEEKFEEALAAWKAEVPESPSLHEDIELEGEARELKITDVVDDETVRRRFRLGYAIHLTLGRLAAHQGQIERALKHYRWIPPGAPDYPAAQRERIYLLELSTEYEWAARALGATLPQRFRDSSEFKRALQYARLLAQGERYADAEKMFGRIAEQVSDVESKMMKKVAAPEGQLGAARWLFPMLSAEWEGVSRSPKELGESVAEVRALLSTLERVSASSDSLPVVAQGRRVQERVRERLARLSIDVAELTKLPGVSGQEVDRMNDSVTRLGKRLAKFVRRLTQYRQAYSGRLKQVVRAEAAALESLERQLRAHGSAVDSHRQGLVTALSDRLASHDTAAVLGQVNIEFWRKEAVSQKIERLLFERRKASEPTETFPVEASDPTGPAEVSWGLRRAEPTPKDREALGQ